MNAKDLIELKFIMGLKASEVDAWMMNLPMHEALHVAGLITKVPTRALARLAAIRREEIVQMPMSEFKEIVDCKEISIEVEVDDADVVIDKNLESMAEFKDAKNALDKFMLVK